MIKAWVYLISISFLSLSVFSQEKSWQVPNRTLSPSMSLVSGTLENGLQYFILPNKVPQDRLELRLLVKSGSIFEPEAREGLAHYLEHMAFNGTDRFTKQDIKQFFDRVGIRFGTDLNAFTSFDHTRYQLSIPVNDKSQIDTALALLSDFAGRISFSEAAMATEKKIVLEEKRMIQSPGTNLRRAWRTLYFKDSIYEGRSGIGNRESIEAIEKKDLLEYYKTWYQADLMAVVAVGAVEPEQMAKAIKKHFGTIPAKQANRPSPNMHIPAHKKPLHGFFADKDAGESWVALAFKRPTGATTTLPDFYHRLLDDLVVRMIQMRLKQLEGQGGLPMDGTQVDEVRPVSKLKVLQVFSPVPGGDHAQTLDVLMTEIARIHSHGFTAKELNRQKKLLLQEVERSFGEQSNTNSHQLAEDLAKHFFTESPYLGPQNVYQLTNALLKRATPQRVHLAAKEMISQASRVVFALSTDPSHLPDVATVEATWARLQNTQLPEFVGLDIPDQLMSKTIEPGSIKAEKRFDKMGITRWVLANGMEIYLKPTTFRNDQILVQMINQGGLNLASSEIYPSAFLAQEALAASPLGKHDPDGLAFFLKSQGVELNYYAQDSETGFRGESTRSGLEVLMQLVHLYVTQAKIDENAFQAVQHNRANQQEAARKNPNAIFMTRLEQGLYANHPRAAQPDKQALLAAKKEHAQSFLRQGFDNPGGFKVILVGSFTPDQIQPFILKYLGSLKPQANLSHSKTEQKKLFFKSNESLTLRLGKEQEASHASVFVTNQPWHPMQRFQIKAMARMFQDALRKKLRDEMGSVYWVRVETDVKETPEQAARVSIYFKTDPKNLKASLAAIDGEIAVLCRQGPSAESMARYKTYMQQQHKRRAKNNGFWRSAMSFYARHSNEMSMLQDDSKWLDQLAAEDLKAIAVNCFQKGRRLQVTMLPEN